MSTKNIKTHKKKSTLPAKKTEFTAQETIRASAFIEKVEKGYPTKLIKKKDSLVPEDSLWWPATLFEATGTVSPELGRALLNQGVNAKYKWHEDQVNVTNEIIIAMHEIRPLDAIEGMLATQMVAVHNLMMECIRRSMLDNQHPDAIYRYSKLANHYCRTYIMLVDALNKHRGKGQQKVTVEHVHVNAGGQAIVGNIHQGVGQNEKKTQ